MTDEQREGSIMTVQIGPEHIEAAEQGARALHKVAADRGHNYGPGTNHEMRQEFYAASQRLRDHAARLAEVAAYLKGQMHDD